MIPASEILACTAPSLLTVEEVDLVVGTGFPATSISYAALLLITTSVLSLTNPEYGQQ